MRVLVCGSRTYPRPDVVRAFVSRLARKYPNAVIIHGAAPGVDTWAGKAAAACGLAVIPFPADWSQGRGAGAIRNRQMLKEGRPDVVVAFHFEDSPGTRDMIAVARRALVPVHVYGPDGREACDAALAHSATG